MKYLVGIVQKGVFSFLDPTPYIVVLTVPHHEKNI